jgi:peptidyl-prolyl cis-trans isomerase SurA
MQSKICLNKKLIFLPLLYLILFLSNLYAIENKIVLKINNEIVTSLDIKNEIQYLKSLNPSIKNLSQEKINLIGKNSLIREKIKENEILKYVENIQIEKKILDKLINNRYSKLDFSTKNQFLEYLKINQVDINIIEKKISIEAVWNQLIYSKFSSKVKIDENNLKKKIKGLNDKKKKSYLLSEIFFKISDKKILNTKYDEIKNIILENGFESAALTYSISDSSEIGGKLEWIEENSLNKTIKENLSKLEKDSFTRPIFTQNGYLILKIRDIKFTQIQYDEESQLKKLIDYETNQQLNQYSNNYFNKIKKDIIINEF